NVSNGADFQGQNYAGGATATIDGTDAYFNSYTAESATAFAALAPTDPVAAAALLVRTDVDLVKPEQVKAFELGYRGEFKGFNIDVNGYYNIYNDFIGNLTVIAPLYGVAQDSPTPYTSPAPTNDLGTQSVHALVYGNTRAFQLYTNTDIEIKSLGFGFGVTKKLPRNFEVSANYNYAEFDFDQAKDPSFEAGFNTPKHRAKASISNDNLFKNFGFNISGRWSDEYYWESTFADGMIDAATVIDAQISYGLPSLKSVVKLGATNIGGKEYRQLIGPGLIGQQYFLSLTINP
ncbi:MAG: TonB-dependent receptor domain-containing protein, partial [Bacteroidia bacterium]